MQFLRRHQYLLCFLAVLVLACILTVRQYLANQSMHVETREDFIFLLEREGETESATHLYQVLIQQLPDLNDRTLVDDLQRTSILVDKAPDPKSLLFKYNATVKKTLEQRAEERLKRALEKAQKK